MFQVTVSEPLYWRSIRKACVHSCYVHLTFASCFSFRTVCLCNFLQYAHYEQNKKYLRLRCNVNFACVNLERWSVSVVINGFYPKTGALEGAEHLLPQLPHWHQLETISSYPLFCSSSRRSTPCFQRLYTVRSTVYVLYRSTEPLLNRAGAQTPNQQLQQLRTLSTDSGDAPPAPPPPHPVRATIGSRSYPTVLGFTPLCANTFFTQP